MYIAKEKPDRNEKKEIFLSKGSTKILVADDDAMVR
jgi:hypothetical protein